jgi:hypothetical protein
MSVVQAITELVANGFTMEQALLAAGIFERHMRPLDATAEKRRIWDRERKRRRAVTKKLEIPPDNSTIIPPVSTGTDHSPRVSAPAGVHNLAKKEEDIPLSETTSPSPHATKPAIRRATRLPEEWAPADSGWQTAIDSLGRAQAETELQKFRNYWVAKAGAAATKLDWAATWRNWVITAGERRQLARASPNGSSRQARQDADAKFLKWCMEPDDEQPINRTPDFFDGPTIDGVATRVS